MGKPTVAFAIDGIPELLNPFPELLVNPYDYIDFSRKINNLLNSPTLCKNLSKRLYYHAREKYIGIISLRNIRKFFNLKNSQIESRTIEAFGEEWTRYDQEIYQEMGLKKFLMIILIFSLKKYLIKNL